MVTRVVHKCTTDYTWGYEGSKYCSTDHTYGYEGSSIDSRPNSNQEADTPVTR